jgi:hypothetical protein
MGSVVKSIGNAVVGGLKDIGKAALQAVGGPAIDMLKNIAGSGFDALAGAAKGLVSSIPLVGPLLSPLVDKLAGGLKDKLLNGGEQFLKDQIKNFTGVQLESGQTVSPASIGSDPRTQAAAAATTQVANSSSSVLSGIKDITGAGGGLSSTSSIAAELRQQALDAGADPKQLDTPEMKTQLAMQAIQKQTQRQNELMQMMSNLQQTDHDTKKSILQNFRV